MGKTGNNARREKWLFYSAAVLAAGAAAAAFLGGAPAAVQSFSYYADRGELLFHGVGSKAISYSMPVLSLLASAAGHLSFDPALPGRAAAVLLCLAAYGIGTRQGGRARGALFSLAAAAVTLTCPAPEAEQILYSFFLLIFLSLELVRQARGGLAVSAASGLAAGASLLVRSPLFAFPPLAVVFQRLSPGRKAGWLAAAALFIFCAYLPLAPWARLNHSLFGQIIFFEQERSTCNIITGASGIVYTIEGDARAFAGLSRTESVYPWAIKTILSNPGRYAFSVAKRVWQVFLMFPLLALLAGAGLFFYRKEPEARLLAFFSAYFVFIHCLLSIEERYFYPLRYVLALLAAGGVWELGVKAGLAARGRGKDYFTAPLFALVLAATAATLGAVWRYPGAAKPPLIAVSLELEKYPADPWLLRKKGEILLSLDLTREGLGALEQACALRGGEDLCYLTRTIKTAGPQDPPRLDNYYELLLVKLMRELALGHEAAAGATLTRAREEWQAEKNAIKGPRFEEDENNLAKIKESNKTFWDMDLSAALAYLPPEDRASALDLLSRLTPLTPKLRALQLAYGRGLSKNETGELAALRKKFELELPEAEFSWCGTARELTAELLSGPIAPQGTGGGLGLLLDLRMSPAEAVAVFSPSGPAACGPAVKAAARTFLADEPGRAAAARRLTAADPDNFAYTLIWLKASSFRPDALKEAAENLKAKPYPLVAGARAWARRGDRAAAAQLALAAVRAGNLGEEGWSELLFALQEAGDFKAGLKAAGSALRELPGSPTLLNSRGVLRRLSGDAAGSAADFEAALRADPSNFSALMNLGSALENLLEKGKAAAVYRRALQAAAPGPQKQDAERALSSLQARP